MIVKKHGNTSLQKLKENIRIEGGEGGSAGVFSGKYQYVFMTVFMQYKKSIPYI